MREKIMIELDLADKYDQYVQLGLWIGKTATSEQSVELDISGLLNMQTESLACTLTKEDAIKLANTILKELKASV